MARNGFPDEENNYSDSDPTQYANYGGTGGQAYSEYDEPGYSQPPTGYSQPPTGSAPQTGYGSYPPPSPSWHQRPAVLIGLGALTAALLALLFYAIVSFTNAGSSKSPTTSSSSPAATTSSSPGTSEAPPPPAPTTQTAAPAPSSSEAPAPSTVTATVTPTTTAPPTTSQPPSTSTTVSTSVTTVTETTTKPVWTWPTRPKPTLMEPTPEPRTGG